MFGKKDVTQKTLARRWLTCSGQNVYSYNRLFFSQVILPEIRIDSVNLGLRVQEIIQEESTCQYIQLFSGAPANQFVRDARGESISQGACRRRRGMPQCPGGMGCSVSQVGGHIFN